MNHVPFTNLEKIFIGVVFVLTGVLVYLSNPEETAINRDNYTQSGLWIHPRNQEAQSGKQTTGERHEIKPKYIQQSTSTMKQHKTGTIEKNDSTEVQPLSGKLIHIGFSTGSIQQEYINYAYQKGGENLLFLLLCENGGIDIRLQSKVVSNGVREPSFGLCQIHKPDHPEIVNDKRFYSDWKRHIDQCWKLRQAGTLFYGPERKIKGKPCYVYMKQFITNLP